MSKNISFNEAFELLKKANDIVITSHIHPDGDAVGASLAMYHALHEMNKSVNIYINDNIPDCFYFLSGCEIIQKTPDNKLEADLILLLDARTNRVGGICEKIFAPILNIDHHISNDKKVDYLILYENMSSTCEILFYLMKENNISITKDIAMCLYMGIATDTGFFRFSSTNSSSFEVSSELIRYGANPNTIADNMATKTFYELQLIAKAMQTIKLFNNGKAIGIFLDKDLSELEQTDVLIDMIRFTKGVDIAFLLKYECDNTYRLRMRSRYTDVSKIAIEIGGGGHTNSAGATLVGNEALSNFISIIESI